MIYEVRQIIENYLCVVRQRTGPNVTIARLCHLLARADVTFARCHRQPRLQRIPDIIAAMEQYHVAKHYAASSPIMRTWWTQQRAVRLKGDNQAYVTCVTCTLRQALSLVTVFSAQTCSINGRNFTHDTSPYLKLKIIVLFCANVLYITVGLELDEK